MIWNIPNILSLARLVLFLPLLWVLAILGQPTWLGAVLILALLTDAADGWLARALDQVTALGARLDSIADNILLPSAVAWLLMLRPEVLAARTGLLLALSVGLWTAAITIGWVRFRRFANLHLYSHKVSAVVGGGFVVVAFLYGFLPWLFYAAAAASCVGSIESITLLLTRHRVDEHMGSIFRRSPGIPSRSLRCTGEPR